MTLTISLLERINTSLSSSERSTNSGLMLRAFSNIGNLMCSYALQDNNTCFSHSAVILHIGHIL